MEKNQMNRRSFLKGLGTLGIGALAASTPWLAAFSEVEQTKDERIRIGMIGPGSRGQFLLSFLAQNPNHVYTKEELFRAIWGMESLGDIATVTVHIKKIREKIEFNTARPQYIETIWGVGYRFKV